MAEKKKKIASIEKESEKPEFWKDPEASGKLSKELADLKEEVGEFERLEKDFADAKELPELVHEAEEKVAKFETRAFLSGKYDRGNAILTITAGAGGQDAQDWAALLLRMYGRYCEKKGWRAEVVHESLGEQGAEGRIGIKQVSLEVEGRFAYGLLKSETGVHRLVRQSPFSAKQLRHTSFAAVEVLPKVNAKEEQIELKPEEVRVEFFRASGPGGQNVNKRETAVRITHLPTNTQVVSQAQRSQQQNKEKASEMLAAKLYQQRELERAKEMARLHGAKTAIEWGSQIRSYVLHPYKLVKDARSGVETGDAEAVLDGDLDAFAEAALRLGSG